MKPHLLAAAILALPCWTSTARARDQQGILFGPGEALVHVCDLPLEARAELRQRTQFDLAVGYFYQHFSVFDEEFNFWSWDGKYVLYQGRRYLNVTDEEMVQLLGREKYDSLGKPLAYRVPFASLTAAVLAFTIGVLIYRSSPVRTKRLLKDARYQEALRIYSQNLPNEREANADEKKTAIAAGIAYLQLEHHMTAHKAERDFLLILAEFDRVRSYDLRNQAAMHELEGEWERSIEYYEQAAELQKNWNRKDYEFLLACVRRVRSKQLRAGGE